MVNDSFQTEISARLKALGFDQPRRARFQQVCDEGEKSPEEVVDILAAIEQSPPKVRKRFLTMFDPARDGKSSIPRSMQYRSLEETTSDRAMLSK